MPQVQRAVGIWPGDTNQDMLVSHSNPLGARLPLKLIIGAWP